MDFAPNVTARYRLQYRCATRVHSIMCRAARGTTFAATEALGISLFSGLFTALDDLMFDDLAFLSADVALTDSDLFFPAAVPAAVTGLVPIAQATKQDSITHITFSGRGTLGSKVTLHVYGVSTLPDLLPANAATDFVITGAESTNVAAAISGLNAAGAPFVAIDNTNPSFRSQVTIKVNDFWLRTVRAGG